MVRDSGTLPTISRRAALQYSGLVGLVSVAGCLGNSANGESDPIALNEQNQCEVCGMIIADYPGPNGQIFYQDNQPSRHENPAWFDSVMGCMFPYYFDHKSLGWNVNSAYVTDYSAIEWEIRTVSGQEYISSTVTEESFTDALEAYYVTNSSVYGAMGPELIPFSDEADATEFAEDTNGEITSFDEISPSDIQSGGSDTNYRDYEATQLAMKSGNEDVAMGDTK